VPNWFRVQVTVKTQQKNSIYAVFL